MKNVVMFSSGLGSWAAAKRVAAWHGTASLTLLFADTKEEDEDNYRFLHEAAANVGGQLVIVEDGRDIWQVFRDHRLIGNSRVAKCSHVLKQEVCRAWVEANCTPDDATLYVGIAWDEQHRIAPNRERWAPYRVEAPLTMKPLMTAKEVKDLARSEGLRWPRLYDYGFPHANCGGFCVRAGHAQFKRLLEVFPERYAKHEQKEEEMREMLGKDVSILRDRRGGTTVPLPMREFRERVQAGGQCDLFDWGGCGCFTEDISAS